MTRDNMLSKKAFIALCRDRLIVGTEKLSDNNLWAY